MGSIDRRIRDLEEQFAATYPTSPGSVRPKLRAVLDRIATVRRGEPDISDEEKAEVADFVRELKAALKKRRAEGRV